MTKEELHSLVKDGDLWAKIENFLAQQIDAAKQEAFDAHKNALAEKATELAALSSAVTQARAVILDEKVNDEDTVKALKAQLDKFDQPEIEKKEAALDAQITKLQAEKDALRGRVIGPIVAEPFEVVADKK